jgi:hypothetical protein
LWKPVFDLDQRWRVGENTCDFAHLQLLLLRVMHNPRFTAQEMAQIEPLLRILERQDPDVYRSVRERIIVEPEEILAPAAQADQAAPGAGATE